MLEREWSLRTDLDTSFAIRPVELNQHQGREVLILEDQGGEPLVQILEATRRQITQDRGPRERAAEFQLLLRIAAALAGALSEIHRRGFIHKNIKPAHVLADASRGQVWLTGFGIASRVPRDRPDGSSERIAGSLAYMAPEQTGRTNGPIDPRSDLYAVGVTLYEMFTGSLPFGASTPSEWVHCHIARQATPPTEKSGHIPPALSAIIMKLMAKSPEQRYQTAAGLEFDLRRCLQQFEADGEIDDFELGVRDTAIRPQIPENLYGREREMEALLSAFNRVQHGGEPELILVSGYSGIGKSSLVTEFRKSLAPAKSLFAAGKFEQFKNDIPFSTLAQAFQDLIRSILAKSDADLAEWRTALREALGSNARLIVDLVPELELIIGEPLPLNEISPHDAQLRFKLVFRRFLCVFAKAEHPLILFLDDLQWLDPATLDLIKDLLTQTDVRDLLLVGAYRENEVHPSHALILGLGQIQESGGRIGEVRLEPLTSRDLNRLVADSLHCHEEQAAPLAAMVLAKTHGNPFFAIQFLHVVTDEGLLDWDPKAARWSWDLNGISAKGYTDNVVEFLTLKLTRLPRDTLAALGTFACLGTVAEITTLSVALEMPEERVHAALQEGVRQHLIERLEASYRFLHDRVQEAAYSSIPETARGEVHLRIGRLLAINSHTEKRDDAIFEIVNHLNRGSPLITSCEERERLAELNLSAAKRAKASSAYASAQVYLGAGTALLTNDEWTNRPELAFEMELHAADCEICTGALQAAARRLATLAPRGDSTLSRCAVARRRLDLYTMLGQSERGVSVGLECLRQCGMDLPPHPSDDDTGREYGRLWDRLGSRRIEEIVNLPLMQDAQARAILDLLIGVSMPALYTDQNLYALTVCQAANFSLERGNTDVAPYCYAVTGLIASARFGHLDRGYQLGKMACDLLEARGWSHFSGRTYFFFAAVVPWTRPLAEAIDPVRRAYHMSRAHGDPAFAAFASRSLTTTLLAVGHPLDQVERQAEEGDEFARHFGFFLDNAPAPLALVRTLAGKSAGFGSLDYGSLTEEYFEHRLTSRPTDAFLECYYWIRKARARYFAQDYESAVEAAEKAEQWYASSAALGLFLTEMTEFHFYGALARAARCAPVGPEPYVKHQDSIQRHLHMLERLAANGPQNGQDRVALVGAEMARLEGRELDAERLYEQAIRAAGDNHFVHHEALANELAARFYALRGFKTIEQVYLRNARYGYLRWGAHGKVRHFDRAHPHLNADKSQPIYAGTIDGLGEQLDLATVIKVSQAVAGEVVFEKLLDTLMRTAMEQAGAQRAVLLLLREEGLRIRAESTTRADTIVVQLCDRPVSPVDLPEAMLRYVMRTRKRVLLEDASTDDAYSKDEYVREKRSKSLLCLPIVKQTKLVGILHLENDLTAGAFTPGRVTVLHLLASQAAISLENAGLYSDLQRSEAFLAQGQSISHTGTFGWNATSAEFYWSAAIYDILEYDRDVKACLELVLRRMHPDDRDSNQRRLEEAIRERRDFGGHHRLLMPDGRVKYVHTTGRAVNAGSLDFMGTMRDVTERTLADTALRQAQDDLARINRVTTMGELTASLAHELRQPITGTRTNAEVCLLNLGRDKPDLDRLRAAVTKIVRDAHRADEIINRIRSQFETGALHRELVDVNEVIRETVALLHGEAARHLISIRLELSPHVSRIIGDPVQLQQVMMNLIVNGIEAMKKVVGVRELLIRTQCNDDGGVLVSVSDTGVGFPSPMAEQIFEPFYTTKPHGTGMGLRISRTIVESHQGRLWAESAPGHGATFHLRLPAGEPLVETDR
jgi:PAS domain S-box-containing protein